MDDLNEIVHRSLGQFLEYVNRTKWFGRENEAVSLYAFGFLQRERNANSPLTDPTQIGIEVGAADAPKKGPTSQVRKDLVIWPTPAVNRWHPKEPRSEPLAIMEWKVRRPGMRAGFGPTRDIEWLAIHCARKRETLGYAVLLDLAGEMASLRYTRVTATERREVEIKTHETAEYEHRKW